MPYSVDFEDGARERFFRIDKGIQERLAKKIIQLERDDFKSRHLKFGVPVFIEEVGQYRIVFKTREELKQKRIVFVGTHKEYEKWFKNQP